MNCYLVSIKVIGNMFYYAVPTKELAEKHVKKIKENGYRHHEGNAFITYTADQIVNVSYKRSFIKSNF